MSVPYTTVVVECSPLVAVHKVSWLQTLLRVPHQHRETYEAEEEPSPQVCEALTEVWHSTFSKAPSSPKQLSPCRNLALRALNAQRSREEAQREHQFWVNRLRLLRREAEEAERSLSTTAAVVEQNSTAISDAIKIQLEEERERIETIRKERQAANRVQRDAHHKALREALLTRMHERHANSRQRRQESREATVFVEEERCRELHRRAMLKDCVQQEKVVCVLRRARAAAMRAEETRKLYVQRIDLMEEAERRQNAATTTIIQESSKLVQRLRQIRNSSPTL